MGREIRRVPPNWQHPKNERGNFQPLHEPGYRAAAAEWKAEFAQWEAKTHPHYTPDYEFWDGWSMPPQQENHVPYEPEEATWFQMYETVSEGTPTTPAFATKAELVEHLVAQGESLIGRYNDGPWSRANAERFVESEWAPTMIVSDGVVKTPRDGGF